MQFFTKLITLFVLPWVLLTGTLVLGQATQTLQNLPKEIVIYDPDLLPYKTAYVMLQWIERNTEYAFLPQRQLNLRYANDEFLRNEWLRNGGDPTKDVRALTTLNIHTREVIVYLPMDFDLNKHRDRSILMHELVHYQQYTHYKDYSVDCHNDLEWEAYMTALIWFTEQNIDDEPFVNDRLTKLDSYVECS
jgi:hypothetical protein